LNLFNLIDEYFPHVKNTIYFKLLYFKTWK